jgi:flagellar L-ring protein precursor FlgH
MSLALMMVSCAGLRNHGLVHEDPPKIEPVQFYESEAPARAPGSLFDQSASNASLISDRRAFRLNDIVVINIVEQTTATTTATTDLEKENSMGLRIPSLLGVETDGLADLFQAGSTDGTLVSAGTTSEHEGAGTTARNGTFRGNVAARVIRVLPNGHLIVQGQKTLRINSESVDFYLSGIVDPLMISRSNSVASSEVADLKLNYGGRGVVTAHQNPGLLYRFLNWLWPF